MAGADSPGVDLHSHSLCSDGHHAPAEVIRRAAAAGLGTVALTDHDNFDGLEEAAAAAARDGIRLVPGIEISTTYEGGDVHLLGWFMDPAHRRLRETLAGLREARECRLDGMLRALSRAGAPVTEEAVRERIAGPAPGRPHVAAALVAAGHAASVQDAFDRWLKRGRPGYVPLARPDAAEAVDLLREAGGVAAVAHPGLGVPDATIQQLARAGLAGLEADHPAHAPDRRKKYRALARRLGLIPTAGSDFHGDADRYHRMGAEAMDEERLDALLRRRP
jgi:predicted metal-dependent phosphoesterase TrpH